ncbi:MAG TPA: SRPBCC family protein [Gemmatirosa sp.]
MARSAESMYGGAYAGRSNGSNGSSGAHERADPEKARGKHGATARAGEPEHAGANVNTIERAVSVAAGAALAAYGLKRKDWGGLAAGVVGGLLVERGVTGHCMAYDALGLTSVDEDGAALPHKAEGGVTQQHGGSASVDAKSAKRVIQTFTIFGRMPGELYDYWRKLEHLPRILQHLESVKELDNRRSHWVAKAPAGQKVEWDAEIINDVPGQIIAWRSLPGASVPNAGAVTFRDAPGGRGAEVKVELSYEPPLGKLGVAVAKMLGEEPSVQVREDLRRYKQLLEAGEIPVSENPGQGKRAKHDFDAQVNRGQTGADVLGLQQKAVGDAHQAVHQPMPSDQARGANSTLTPKEGR